MKTGGIHSSEQLNNQTHARKNGSALLNAIPFGMMVVDIGGKIQGVNGLGRAILGAESEKELRNHTLDEFFSVDCEKKVMPPGGFPASKKLSLFSVLHPLNGDEKTLRMVFSPAGNGSGDTLVFLIEEETQPLVSDDGDIQHAYGYQKNLNRKLGEILELSRTFSLYLNVERVMNQIVRVVSESLGYGMVGIYLKEEKSNRMRVATHTDSSLDISLVDMPNPGVDWDILQRITTKPSNLNLIGGKLIRFRFGDDSVSQTEGQSKSGIVSSSEIWQMDDALLALVRVEGSANSGFLRVSRPLGKRRTGSLIKNPPLESERFCQQALWIFATQAAIAIENAQLFEKAQVELNERRQTENELAEAKSELESRIQTRTLRLEKANQDLQEEILKREFTQEELDSQKEFLRQVLDTNPTLIYVRDRGGHYTLVNEAAAKSAGRPIQEIVGRTDEEINQDIQQIMRWRHEDLEVLDNHREILITEERIKDHLGHEHYLQTIKRPIRSANNQPDAVLGVSIDITDRKRAEERALQANIELAQAYDATIEGWSRALDFRDHETEGHSRRVKDMTLQLARAMGIPEKELENLKRGAWLHDIGKVGIPDIILLKTAALTENEWKTMRSHPTIGYEILKPIRYLHPALDIPRYHHEKWDGTGYPNGLAGDAIPLAARIFAVVDVWDAMTQDRVYRKALPEEETLVYIQENAGKHFDPTVVKVFIKNLNEIVTYS